MSAPTPARPRGPKRIKVDPEHLLDAAQAVFAEEGLRAASLRAIARRAGCDPALIYYHFENKEAIFTALLQRKFSSLHPALAALADPEDPSPVREKLGRVLEVFRQHVAHDAGFRSLVRGEIVHGAEPIKDVVTGYLRPVQEVLWSILSRGVASGELRADLPVPLASLFLVRTYMEILDLVPVFSERMANLPPETALDLAQQAWLDFFWRGAEARPAAPTEHP